MNKTRDNAALIWIAGLIVIPVITPWLGALDANAPRLVTQSLWVVGGLAFYAWKKPGVLAEMVSFFKTPIGILYGIFFLMILLSGVKAINPAEYMVQLAKVLPVFIAVQLVFVLVRHKRKLLNFIALVLSAWLLIEGLVVLMQVIAFIQGEVPNVTQFGWIYHNRNILSASILIKVPASLYLISNTVRNQRILGLISLGLAVLAIFFLGSRAFFLGILLLLIVVVLVTLGQHISRQGGHLKKTLLIFSGILLAGYGLSAVVENQLYPPEKDWIADQSVIERFDSTLDTGNNIRLASWKRTLRLIGDEPLLGVGAGNWKIRILAYESPDSPDFKYMVKNHNDFLEITAEAGILGGLAFFGFLFLLVATFFRQAFRRRGDPEEIQYWFLPATGLLMYGIDAFFNFPADRPVIQSLLALLAGSGAAMAYSGVHNNQKPLPQKKRLILPIVYLVLMIPVSWISLLQLKSVRIQREVKEDVVAGTYTQSADYFIREYPKIPDLNIMGSPLVIDQTHYLLHEKRDEEAKQLLLGYQGSPWDRQREYYLGLIYIRLGQPDSAKLMLEKVIRDKPLFENGKILYNTLIASQDSLPNSQALYQKARQAFEQKDYAQAVGLITTLLGQEPGFTQLYPVRAWCYFYLENYPMALQDIEVFLSSEPSTSEIENLRQLCQDRLTEAQKPKESR